MANVYDEALRRDVLAFIEEYIHEKGISPSLREICKACQRKAPSQIREILRELRTAGKIMFTDHIPRSIRLPEQEHRPQPQQDRPVYTAVYINQTANINAAKKARTFTVPILGYTFGGPFNISFPDGHASDDDILFVQADMLPKNLQGKELFALYIKGDSMKDAGINDGDTVIFQRVETANSGDMVAVWTQKDDGTTLKYFYQEEGQVRLQPANDQFDPIIVKSDIGLRVQGKAICVVRADKPFLL